LLQESGAILSLRILACGAEGAIASITHALLDARDTASTIILEHCGNAHALLAAAPAADAVLLLVDAQHGVVPEVRQFALLASLAGLRQLVVVVGGMDHAQYTEARFREIERDVLALSRRLGGPDTVVVPASTAQVPWHKGPALPESLRGMESARDLSAKLPLRMPVHRVGRQGEAHGTIVSGTARPGTRIRVQPKGQMCTIVHISSDAGPLAEAGPGEAVTLALDGAPAPSAGDLLAQADEPASVADQFEATIAWTAEQPMLGGRPYQMRLGMQAAIATPAAPKYRFDPGTLEHVAARTLARGEVGVCNLSLDQPVAFDPHRENRDTGRFELADRASGETVGTGTLHFALRRADNIQIQAVDVDRAARARLKGQSPCVVWLTGLSGAGKSTIANLLDRRLHALGRHTYLMDGDNVRHGLNRDLGFSAADRVENVRRVAEVAKLMADAGLIVIVSLISPFRSERRMARELMKPGEFIEVFVDAPLAVAERRDPKGLYRKARRGELQNFTGIDSPYEAPERPEVHVDTSVAEAEACVERVLEHVARRGAS